MSRTAEQKRVPELGLPRGVKLPHLAPKRTLVVLAALAMVCLVGSGVLWLRNGRTADLEAARADAVQHAKVHVARLLSYDYRTLADELPQRSDLMAGDFEDEYATLVKSKLSPAARQKQVVTRTDVVTAAVIDVDAESAELLLFLNQVSATKGSDTPVLSGSRVRVTMEKVDGTWKVAGIKPV